eukprot:gb/GECG01002962.1/.p1 GENE.gb/GECG01002962.1/~~gb/GECG01002962.1/.p1  ORF type:complete len:457 (+),score=112.70 gb/GECG01002962.1/:1-1371(+)
MDDRNESGEESEVNYGNELQQEDFSGGNEENEWNGEENDNGEGPEGWSQGDIGDDNDGSRPRTHETGGSEGGVDEAGSSQHSSLGVEGEEEGGYYQFQDTQEGDDFVARDYEGEQHGGDAQEGGQHTERTDQTDGGGEGGDRQQPTQEQEDHIAALLQEPVQDDTGGEDQATDEFDDVPDFANKYNRDLHAEILQHEKEVLRHERSAEEHKNRVSVMREHLRNVQNEIQHTQKLVEARNQEIKTEDHMRQMSERSLAKVRKELEDLKKRNQEIQDQISSVQLQLHNNNQTLEQFREQMNWNQQELEQWVEAAHQKDEDNMALEKYTKADDQKTRDLARRLEKLTDDLNQKQRGLDHEVTETQAKQIELDKTADDFHALHSERQELVGKWKEAIRIMESRDNEIAEAGERFATAKTKLAQRKESISELNRVLNRQKTRQSRNGGRNKESQLTGWKEA